VDTVVIVSGGLDSVTLAHQLHAHGHALHLLSFDYGQRHRKELGFAARCASRLGAPHDIVDLSAVGRLLGGSALTDAIAVPDGHYAEESMRVTVVPNRNAIMLSIAVGVAVAEGASRVGFAAHGGDHFIYPDCRPAFVEAFEEMTRLANEGFGDVTIEAPFLHMSKADIVRLGSELGVDFADTWSCYKGGEVHCRTCGTCVERREAFELAGVADPTTYLAPAGAHSDSPPASPTDEPSGVTRAADGASHESARGGS
jgi:7-cyano-7-deazaguanine synthase